MLGVVVSPNLVRWDAPPLLAIFIDKDRPLYFVKNCAHCVDGRMSKEERKEREKLVKRKGLEFGDWISFSQEQVANRIINDYEKIRPAMEFRAHEDFMQFQTECVFCPNNGKREFKCYSEFFGVVEASAEIASRFLPDVACLCWVSVEIGRATQCLVVSFGEYVDIAESQEAARLAPWNANDPRFVISCADVDEISDSGTSVVEEEIFDAEGIISGTRTIFSEKTRDFPVLITYLHPDKDAATGFYVRFDAVFNPYFNAYTVRNYNILSKMEPVPSISVDFGETTLLKVSVWHEPEEVLFGYFREKVYGFGVVRDDKNALAPILLTDPSKGPYEVCVEDIGTDRFGRFVIRTLGKPTAMVVEDAVDKELPSVSEKGYYLGEGVVFLPERTTFECKFSGSDMLKDEVKRMEVGTRLSVTAQAKYVEDTTIFVITDWKASTKVEPVPFQIRLTEAGYIFGVKCWYEKELRIFKSEEFGYLDDPNRKVPPTLKDRTAKLLWLRYKVPGSRTPFSIFSVSPPTEISSDELEKCFVVQDELLQPLLSMSEVVEPANPIAEEMVTKISVFPTVLPSVAVTESEGDSSVVPDLKVDDESSQAECSSPDCSGRLLIRRILNDRKLLRGLRVNSMQDLVVHMITSVSSF